MGTWFVAGLEVAPPAGDVVFFGALVVDQLVEAAQVAGGAGVGTGGVGFNCRVLGTLGQCCSTFFLSRRRKGKLS